ncbi:MAG: preprotein translocase subunit YajC [Chitinivibrionales bacterium]|nr:preprotein translocase subunit YajC [Chitinivibrionales bacterium]
MHYFLTMGMIFLMNVAAFAQDEAPKRGQDPMTFVLMMVAMVAILYFLMIRPEQKKQKDRKSMIAEMKKGDKVVTIGGIIAKVMELKGESIIVKTIDSTTLEVRKGAISEVISREGAVEKETK